MNVKKLVKLTFIGLFAVIVLPIILLSVFVAIAPSGTGVIEKAQEIEKEQVEESGLTTEKKQLIYKEIVMAETKSRNEAEAMYPLDANDPDWKEGNLLKHEEYKKERQEFHKAPIYEKYNISSFDATGIIVEGVQNSWDEE